MIIVYHGKLENYFLAITAIKKFSFYLFMILLQHGSQVLVSINRNLSEDIISTVSPF